MFFHFDFLFHSQLSSFSRSVQVTLDFSLFSLLLKLNKKTKLPSSRETPLEARVKLAQNYFHLDNFSVGLI